MAIIKHGIRVILPGSELRVIQLTNRWLNIVFLCIIYCVTNAVAVMYSRNIPMAEKRSVCFQIKK